MADNNSFSNDLLMEVYFITTADGDHLCKGCNGEKRIKGNKSGGYSNLWSHVKNKHKTDYLTKLKEAEEIKNKNKGGLPSYFGRTVSKDAVDIFKWMECVIMADMPFSYVENQWVQSCAIMQSITTKTLKKYLVRVGRVVEDKLKLMIPKSFGIIFDGWTLDREHYIAVFLTWTESTGYVQERLICCGVQDEEHYSVTSFSADDIGDYIYDELDLLGRSDARLPNSKVIEFITADNCATNVCLANKMKVPLIGCYSHKLNLEVQSLEDDDADTAAAIRQCDQLMGDLRSLKNASRLRRVTSLVPERRNVTRWYSLMKMLRKEKRLRPYIDRLKTKLCWSAKNSILSEGQRDDLDKLSSVLKNFDDVSKKFQASGDNRLMLYQVRDLCQELISATPGHVFTKINPESELVKNKEFESAVCKVQSHQEDLLTEDETTAIAMFLKNPSSATGTAAPAVISSNFADRVLEQTEARKKARYDNESNYRSLNHICPTSNICERLFSRAKLIMTDQRKSMNPWCLELLLFLRYNKDLWDEATVQHVMCIPDTADEIVLDDDDNF